MPHYTHENTLRIAKRFNNTKRTYLLVNPLQAKHLPVSPSQSLEMMTTLGKSLAAKYPQTRLVIGFAETATAIGAAVAQCFPQGCVYLQTTRETVSDDLEWVLFLEEHSHAVEQKLCADQLASWIDATDAIMFIDDEISTGKTLVNMIQQLNARFPGLSGKTLAAASILNRVSPEDEAKMLELGIHSEYLVKLPQRDYSAAVESIRISEAADALSRACTFQPRTLSCQPLMEPRTGVDIHAFTANCSQMAEAFLERFAPELPPDSSILVLGTEECMYPALLLGHALEQRSWRVRCHATTRSPIGISADPDYPITSGSKLQSFFDAARGTYIYNLDHYDVVIVVSDTPQTDLDAMKNLVGAMEPYRNTTFYYVQGGQNVWYVSES